MSVQQAAIDGAKSHLGPYAICHIFRELITTMCTNGGEWKGSTESVIPGHVGAVSSSSKGAESEISLWESLIKSAQILTRFLDASHQTTAPFCSIWCRFDLAGWGKSVWKRRQRRVVTPQSEQISRATFSSRGSTKPDAAIIAKHYQVGLSIQLIATLLFIHYLCSLPVSDEWERVTHTPLITGDCFVYIYLFLYHTHVLSYGVCVCVCVTLMVSVSSERSWPRHVEWDLFWFRCPTSARGPCISLFSVCVHFGSESNRSEVFSVISVHVLCSFLVPVRAGVTFQWNDARPWSFPIQ